MIIKNKDISSSKDIKQIAGDKQEQDVAFFLRRAYKNDKQVFVFNDLRFEHNDEIAQIDHLILYPYGFVLIESKSITGEIKVNKNQEWTRSYKQQWSGMRSPIKQVQLQEKLLRELLFENSEQILPKKLFGVLQEYFGHRCWDHLCAISSNAIVHRDDIPKKISNKLAKSEFVVDMLTKLMNIPTNIVTSTFDFSLRPYFSPEQMDSISKFLIQQHKTSASEKVRQVNSEKPAIQTNQTLQNELNLNTADTSINGPITAKLKATTPAIQSIVHKLACKKCAQTEHLQAAGGKYGYYVKCPNCQTNTAMKRSCLNYNSKNTKVHKQKAYYHLTCQDCHACHEIFVEEPRLQIDTSNQHQKHF